MTTEFNRDNETHMRLAKAHYFAWYGPKDAAISLNQHYNINATTAILTRLYHSFKSAGIPRYDRRNTLLEHLN